MLKKLFIFFSLLFYSKNCFASENIAHKQITWNNSIVHIINIPKNFDIKPVINKERITLKEFLLIEKAKTGINGGFFNYSDGFPVSYIYINGKLKAEPRKNKALINNRALKPILEKIFNERVEFRILQKGTEKKLEIVRHKEKIKDGYELLHSLQAGPRLLPNLDLEKEGFIIKTAKGRVIRDGIGSLSRNARSAIGIKASGEVLFVTVSKNRGLTIKELAQLMSYLKCVSAMALDGGKSTSLVWQENNTIKQFFGTKQLIPYINSAIVAKSTTN